MYFLYRLPHKAYALATEVLSFLNKPSIFASFMLFSSNFHSSYSYDKNVHIFKDKFF